MVSMRCSGAVASLIPFREFDEGDRGSAADPLLAAARCCAAIVGRVLADFFTIERLGRSWVTGSPVPSAGLPIAVPSPLCAHAALHAHHGRHGKGGTVLLLRREALAASGVLVTKFSPATGARASLLPPSLFVCSSME